MGEAADQKVTEIGESRRQLETDIRELGGASPRPVPVVEGDGRPPARQRRVRCTRPAETPWSKRPDAPPAAEVVVRIVRDDA